MKLQDKFLKINAKSKLMSGNKKAAQKEQLYIK